MRRKATPDRTSLVRDRVIALSRRQRGDGDAPEKPADPKEPKKPDSGEAVAKRDPKAEPATEPKTSEPASKESAEATPEVPVIDPPAPAAEPWPDATPPPMNPVRAPTEPDVRARTETVVMPAGMFGRPPEMPKTTSPPPPTFGDVEDPTHMPGPREIPGGKPDDPAAPPGRVPPGDSRSLRHDRSFALIYRIGTFVISRVGIIGTRGQWRVVEYPTSTAASHSYAKECSRFASEGFSDYRE